MEQILKRKISFEDYIVASTAISIFLQQKVAHVGLDIFLGYPLILINSLLLLLDRRLVVHRYQIFVIGWIAFQSLIAAEFSSTPLHAVVSQILGISVMSIYYFSAITTTELNVRNWMILYSKVAFSVAIISIIKFLIERVTFGNQIRLDGIFSEPSYYVYLTLPAIGYYVSQYIMQKKYALELIIFFISYIFANSTLGYFGLFIIFFFTIWRRVDARALVGSLALASGSAVALYNLSVDFRIRVSDTFRAILTSRLEHVNASTFALLSNLYVTINTFLRHPLMGVGIGGYQYDYRSYVSALDAMGPISLIGLNKDDASSLFFRVTAELGIIGILFLLALLVFGARIRNIECRVFRDALLPFLIVRMARFGSYFSLELYFFMGLFILNAMEGHRSNLQSAGIND